MDLLGGQLAQLRPVLEGLRKYESNFTVDAKTLLQKSLAQTDALVSSLQHWTAGTDVASFLQQGPSVQQIDSSRQSLVATLSSMLTGSVPLPRSSKDILAELRTSLQSVRVDSDPEAGRLAGSLNQLYTDAVSQAIDVDVVEVRVDEVMRQVLAILHGGATSLSGEELQAELEALKDAISKVHAAGGNDHILSLALNSLQRLHAGQLRAEEEEEDEEEEDSDEGNRQADDLEDDDDDPFFMPLPSAAVVKLADEKKFKLLAMPLSPEEEAKPMLELADEPATPSITSMGGATRHGSTPGLTAADFEPVPEPELSQGVRSSLPQLSAAVQQSLAQAAQALELSTHEDSKKDSGTAEAEGDRSSAAAAAAAGHTSHVDEPGTPDQSVSATAEQQEHEQAANDSHQAVSDSSKAEAGETLAPPLKLKQVSMATPADMLWPGPPPDMAAQVPEVNGVSASRAQGQTSSSGAAAAAAGVPTEEGKQLAQRPSADDDKQQEKQRQFAQFLAGDNPGACMFHAQMRLSHDGCRKLAAFLSGSQRVRALSLSHNFIGDEGLAIICQGLEKNLSVQAIDLPENNITDVGAEMLAKAIAKNTNLTQLQLSNNKIGDRGAQALAALIKGSESLKKLGLSNNEIGKVGCQALTAAISSNQSLKHLQLLPGNPVEEKDAKALAKALKRKQKFSIRSLFGSS